MILSGLQKKNILSYAEQQKKCSLSLHYNGRSSYILVKGVKIYDFKATDVEINAAPLCWGNHSKDFSFNNMKKSGLYRYGYNFSVDYDSIDIDILNIHKWEKGKWKWKKKNINIK